MLIRKRGAVNYYSSVIIDGKRTELPLGQSLPRALELHAENMRVYRSDVRIKANPPSLSYAKTLFASVIRNAKTRNIYVGITVEDIEKMLVNAEFRCEVTGIHFDMIKKPGYRVRPWIPSVDRIDSAKPL